ncbi:MAG: VWA-like domain-containing protein, partial [Pseudomonadota bacterium]
MSAPDPVRRYGSSRGTRAIQAMVEYAPATGGLALWMQHVDVEADADLPAPVANDGKTVFYAPRFTALSLEEQIGWVAHETLHVAFRHVQRRTALTSVLGDVDARLYNACADALVNSTLSHLTWLQLPKAAVYLDALMSRVFKDTQAAETLLLQWDVERLYRAVDDRRQGSRAQASGQSQDQNTASGNSASETEQSTGEQGARPREDGPRSAMVRAMARASEPDLLPSPEAERPEAVADATRAWAERISRGHAADGESSMLRTVSADLPRSRTPWAQVLRQSLASALVREPELSWSRPARSWLANRGRTPSGRRMPWEPGVITSRSVPRLALILDLSGSIDDALLERFATHIDAITRQLQAQIVLIAGDDQVRYEAVHEPGQCGLGTLPEMPGGGGTNFVPLIAAAARHHPDQAVVLTDLQGPAGAAPGFAVLWAVP